MNQLSRKILNSFMLEKFMLRKMKLKEWELYKIFRQAASWPADESSTARFTYSGLKAGNIRQSKTPTGVRGVWIHPLLQPQGYLNR